MTNLPLDPDPQWIHESPVLGLRHNVVARFEAALSIETLQRDVAEEIVSPAIDIGMAAAPPQTPCVDGRPAQIFVGLSYLEGLWAAAYGLFVRQEHQMRLATREWEGREPDGIEFSPAMVARAEELLEWARSISKEYTDWPKDLPSPRHHPTTMEGDIARKINSIFVDAVAFLLHHELVHAQYGHVALGTNEERLQREKEADIAAFSRFFDHTTSLHEFKLIGWAMLLPLLYALDLVHTPRGLFAERHLHTHHRLAHLMAHLDFADPYLEDYFGFLCADALRSFCIRHSIVLELGGPKFDRVDDALQHIVNELDRFDPAAPWTL